MTSTQTSWRRLRRGRHQPVLAVDGRDVGAHPGRVADRHRVRDPRSTTVAENSTEYARDFNDEQAGTNGAYQAAPGWDYVTGWGTPILKPLIQDIDGGLAPVTSAP